MPTIPSYTKKKRIHRYKYIYIYIYVYIVYIYIYMYTCVCYVSMYYAATCAKCVQHVSQVGNCFLIDCLLKYGRASHHPLDVLVSNGVSSLELFQKTIYQKTIANLGYMLNTFCACSCIIHTYVINTCAYIYIYTMYTYMYI